MGILETVFLIIYIICIYAFCFYYSYIYCQSLIGLEPLYIYDIAS